PRPGLWAFRPSQILQDMGGRGGAYSLDNRTGFKLVVQGRKEENIQTSAPESSRIGTFILGLVGNTVITQLGMLMYNLATVSRNLDQSSTGCDYFEITSLGSVGGKKSLSFTSVDLDIVYSESGDQEQQLPHLHSNDFQEVLLHTGPTYSHAIPTSLTSVTFGGSSALSAKAMQLFKTLFSHNQRD
ncbi:hypothetical protein NFI96_021196, partial [Prochilodus magdalenae]